MSTQKDEAFEVFRTKELKRLFNEALIALEDPTNITEENRKVLESALFLLHYYYSNKRENKNSYAYSLITIALAKVIDPSVTYFRVITRELEECLAEIRDFEDNVILKFENLPQSVKFITSK